MRRPRSSTSSVPMAHRRTRRRAGIVLAMAVPVVVPLALTWAAGASAAGVAQTPSVVGPAGWAGTVQAWSRGSGVELSYIPAEGTSAAELLRDGKAQAAVVNGAVGTAAGVPNPLYAPVAAVGTVVMSAVPDLVTGSMVTDLRVDARTLAELYRGDTELAAARLQSLNPSHRLPGNLSALVLDGPTAQTRQLTSYLAHMSPDAWPSGIVSTMPAARGQTVVRDNAVAVATVDAELKRPDDIGVIGYADSVTASTQPDVSSPTPDTTTSGATGTGSAGTATGEGTAEVAAPTGSSPATSPPASTAAQPTVADTLAAVLNNKGKYVLPTATALSLGAADLVRGSADAELADLPGPVADPLAYPVSGAAFLAVPAALRDQAPAAAAQLAELLRYATRAGQSALPAGAGAPTPDAQASADAVAAQLSSPEPSGSPTSSPTPTSTPTSTASPSGSPTESPSPSESPTKSVSPTPSGTPTGTPTPTKTTPTPTTPTPTTPTPTTPTTPTSTTSGATPTRSATATPTHTTTHAPTPSTAPSRGGGPTEPTGPSGAGEPSAPPGAVPTGPGASGAGPTSSSGRQPAPSSHAPPAQPPEPTAVPSANTTPLSEPPVSPSASPGATSSAEPTTSSSPTEGVTPPLVAGPPPGGPPLAATKAGVSSPVPGGWFFPVTVGILALAFVMRALLNLGRPQR